MLWEINATNAAAVSGLYCWSDYGQGPIPQDVIGTLPDYSTSGVVYKPLDSFSQFNGMAAEGLWEVGFKTELTSGGDFGIAQNPPYHKYLAV